MSFPKNYKFVCPILIFTTHHPSASCKLGLPHSVAANVLAAAENLVSNAEKLAQSNASLSLSSAEGGWALLCELFFKNYFF